jgi:hypothetical protein
MSNRPQCMFSIYLVPPKPELLGTNTIQTVNATIYVFCFPCQRNLFAPPPSHRSVARLLELPTPPGATPPASLGVVAGLPLQLLPRAVPASECALAILPLIPRTIARLPARPPSSQNHRKEGLGGLFFWTK